MTLCGFDSKVARMGIDLVIVLAIIALVYWVVRNANKTGIQNLTEACKSTIMAPGSFLLCAVFFVSGASALTFETIWFRQAGLVFGNSVWAGSMVLASFMAGLAIGNWFAGRFGDRLVRPVWWYAWLEIAIGTCGLALVLLFPFFNQLFAPIFRPFLNAPWILNPLRLTIAFLLLLPPTVAMGATLPLMVKGIQLRQNFGQRLGLLYAFNTFGAVVGTLSCEILLIHVFGIRGTGFVAAIANLLAGIGAMLLSRNIVVKRQETHASSSAAGLSPRSTRILIAAFLSGAILCRWRSFGFDSWDYLILARAWYLRSCWLSC